MAGAAMPSWERHGGRAALAAQPICCLPVLLPPVVPAATLHHPQQLQGTPSALRSSRTDHREAAPVSGASWASKAHTCPQPGSSRCCMPCGDTCGPPQPPRRPQLPTGGSARRRRQRNQPSSHRQTCLSLFAAMLACSQPRAYQPLAAAPCRRAVPAVRANPRRQPPAAASQLRRLSALPEPAAQGPIAQWGLGPELAALAGVPLAAGAGLALAANTIRRRGVADVDVSLIEGKPVRGEARMLLH